MSVPLESSSISQSTADSRWVGLSPADRESFLDAIARHRRSAWRVTAACAVAYALLGFVLAVLMSPLLYGVAGLGLDIVNRFAPVPDLLGFAGRQIDSVLNARGPVDVLRLIKITMLASIPGLLLVAVAAVALRRALLKSPMFDAAKVFGRPFDQSRLAEIQLQNTVQEMAVAASIPAPSVIFTDGSINAAAYGMDTRHATVLFGSRIGETLTRAEMQGVAGHLVGSIANGDMTIGLRMAMTAGIFSLASCLTQGFTDRDRFAATLRLLRALMFPTAKNLELILMRLSDPFGASTDKRDGDGAGAKSQDFGALRWREWAMMPLMGPLVVSGFLSGLVNVMFLGPLISVAWRQRKYTADATSVRLTRDPDALDKALDAMARTGASVSLDAWAGHLCIVDPGSARSAGLLGKSWVSIFPPPAKRHHSLVRMGAMEYANPRSDRSMPLPYLLLLVGLMTIVGVLLCVVVVGLVYVALAMSGLFTVLPIGLLHLLLR